MKISELFYTLSVGELSNLAMSNEGSGTIRDKDQGKLVSYINASLKMMHKRFVLRTKEVLIETVDHITMYHLNKRYALTSDSNEPYRYIIDSDGSPFEEDVVRILEVWDAFGNQQYLNDPGQSQSLFTPFPTILNVPAPVTHNAMSVIYQADHVPFVYVGEDQKTALAQNIDIPGFLESALTNCIAYKVYSHLNGQEHQAKAQEYLTLYEGDCTDIEDKDLVNQSISKTQMKLYERGFV